MSIPDEFIAQFVDLNCAIQQIPAPTFFENTRALFILDRFRTEGLLEAEIDTAGNVIACLPGMGTSRPVVVAAHLDTVFPISTDLNLMRTSERISGPSIGDNSLGLAGLFILPWLKRHLDLQFSGDVWLVGTVGEEGLGNLKGMRAVVERFNNQPLAYIILEGMGLGEIFHRALGVRRYQIACSTSGGHSWTDFGRPSAIHELSKLITRIINIPVPSKPRTTFNVGVISGGTSINTIAAEAQIELDLRSEQVGTLEWLAGQVETLCKQARSKSVEIQLTRIGDRPAGEISKDHALVRLAKRCLKEQGIRPGLGIGSTDANIPLSQGYPAICIGLTRGGQAHTIDEYILTEPIPQGLEQLVQLISRVWEI